MSKSAFNIRAMRRAEGWNPGLRDADSFYAADPHGFLLGLLGDEPLATISAVKYGASFVFETARMYTRHSPDLPLDRLFGVTTFELG